MTAAARLTDRLLAHLGSLEPGPAAEAAAGRELASLEPEEAAELLGALVERAKDSPGAGHALTVASRALMFCGAADLPLDHRRRIDAAAVQLGLTEVAALFLEEDPSKAIDPAATQAPDPLLGGLTLGHKKALARRADGDSIARLALEGDERVVRELLLNPRLTEEQVVRLAARRPARCEALLEVWRSTRWSVRAGVRRALAMNPYTPPEISLKLLPHLLDADLKAIRGDNALHESVRDVAARLLNAKRDKPR